MKITPIATPAITRPGSLAQLVDHYLPHLKPRSIVVVTSKLVSICEGNVIEEHQIDLDALIRREADYYRAATPGPNPLRRIALKNGFLAASAGIDVSNGNGHYVLWPRDPQTSANALRQHLAAKQGGPVGVIFTDSRATPLRRGAVGFGLAHSGFAAMAHYAGRADLFGRPFAHQSANLLDGLAAGAVAAMGEGAESTPLALIEGLDHISFQNADPTPDELAEIKIAFEDDFFTEFLRAVPWDKTPHQT